MICIYDNLLSEKEQNFIFEKLNSESFAWYKSVGDVTAYSPLDKEKTSDDKIFEYLQFSHSFIYQGKQTSDNLESISIIIERLQQKLKRQLFVYRAKANFQTKVNDKKGIHNTPHIDDKLTRHDVAIYYVNDSDSYTYIFKNDKAPWIIEKRIESKRGRIVMFDGSKYHAGSHPQDGARIVINFNLAKQ